MGLSVGWLFEMFSVSSLESEFPFRCIIPLGRSRKGPSLASPLYYQVLEGFGKPGHLNFTPTSSMEWFL